jgi:hypothetical protein
MLIDVETNSYVSFDITDIIFMIHGICSYCPHGICSCSILFGRLNIWFMGISFVVTALMFSLDTWLYFMLLGE